VIKEIIDVIMTGDKRNNFCTAHHVPKRFGQNAMDLSLEDTRRNHCHTTMGIVQIA
jgi:hypothetical protein